MARLLDVTEYSAPRQPAQVVGEVDAVQQVGQQQVGGEGIGGNSGLGQEVREGWGGLSGWKPPPPLQPMQPMQPMQQPMQPSMQSMHDAALRRAQNDEALDNLAKQPMPQPRGGLLQQLQVADQRRKQQAQLAALLEPIIQQSMNRPQQVARPAQQQYASRGAFAMPTMPFAMPQWNYGR